VGVSFTWLAQLLGQFITYLEQAFSHLTQPVHHSMILSAAADLTRTKSELIAQNALLRQQLIVLYRQVNKPRFTQSDRLGFVLLVRRVKHWKAALLIFKPDTLLGWRRQGFHLFWKFKSRNRGGRPKLAPETISLLQTIAKETTLWGAERIHGELLKLNIAVATTTIQKYLRQIRSNHSPSQAWSVFLKNHVQGVWACDFLPVIDLFFCQVHGDLIA
jgi:putative transposase